MNYKAIIFDIDGTAVANKQYAKPSQRLIDVVQKAKEKVHICAATGRIWSTAKWVIELLQLTSPCIISAGSQIVNPVDRSVLWEKHISKKIVEQIMNMISAYPYGVLAASQFANYPLISKFVLQDEPLIYIEDVPFEKCEELIYKLSGIPDIIIIQALSYEVGKAELHITHKDVTKYSAVQKLITLLGIKKEEIIGVGDGDNDIPLFESVGLKVAVGNATEKLKEHADEIVSSAQDDGLAEVIQKYIL